MTPLFPLLRAMRPGQWTKNLLVGAAFFFAYWDPAQALGMAEIPRVAIAMLAFCVVSSAVYLFNDLADRAADRLHPVKRHRPIASGELSSRLAASVALGLLGLGLGLALLLDLRYAAVLGIYLGVQTAYSLALKRVALVDVLLIAIGFVLRAVGGALVVSVEISPWLLLCTFLLALFLALCKRRHEKYTLPAGENTAQRAALNGYDRRLLDQLIAIISASTLSAYAMYTLSEATTQKFGTAGLGLTIPFVVFGLFRYLDLVYRHSKGDRPERILLTDPPLIVNLLLYGLTATLVFVLA